MARSATRQILVPLNTEVALAHGDWFTGYHLDPVRGLVVDLDLRRGDWHHLLKLDPKVKIHWSAVRTVPIQELSVSNQPLNYDLTFGDGSYTVGGQRFTFPLQPHLQGIDLDRRCSVVALRTAVTLSVLGGLGLRGVCWLLQAIFHFNISKSALDRLVKGCADQLPNMAGIAKAMNLVKTITEAHFDELFTLGGSLCALVLRDEHGRIFAVKQVKDRTEATVVEFLTEVKNWGLKLGAFYVDGCEAYRAAIPQVFPGAAIQYDNFHVIQNAFRKLWKKVVARRKELKGEGEELKLECAYSSHRLLALAARIWEGRYLFFTRDENLSDAQQAELQDLLFRDRTLRDVRDYVKGLWKTFEMPTYEEALKQVHRLYEQVEYTEDGVFEKVGEFLKGRFEDMTAYLRHPGMKRNSLAETGMRCLRRLERGHDGFRGEEGLDSYVRLYQAIKYLGWRVHGPSGSAGPAGTATAPLGLGGPAGAG